MPVRTTLVSIGFRAKNGSGTFTRAEAGENSFNPAFVERSICGGIEDCFRS
jgi:hypothetical protein